MKDLLIGAAIGAMIVLSTQMLFFAERSKPAKFYRSTRIRAEDVRRSPLLQRYEVIEPLFRETNVESLIAVTNLQERRQQLIDFIWGGRGFPRATPEVERDIVDTRCNDLPNLKSIDRLTVSMDSGINSIAYHFHPKTEEKKHLIIYHSGHEIDFIDEGERTIGFLLDHDYSVLALAMPLVGINNKPVIEVERIGNIRLHNHDQMKYLDDPIRFFLEPVIVCINQVGKDYSRISMGGLSGGGWTTVLCSAIDERISSSYPVSGSLPVFLRFTDRPNDWGDFEQTYPDLYRISNYLELYILGASGKGRKQRQIINKYDKCAFGGIRYQLYEGMVSEAARNLGGDFAVFVDNQMQHIISDDALEYILTELDQ